MVYLLLGSLVYTLINVFLIYFLNKDFSKRKQEGMKLFKTEFMISYTLFIVQSIFYIISFSLYGSGLFLVLIGLNILFNITIMSFVFDIKLNIKNK